MKKQILALVFILLSLVTASATEYKVKIKSDGKEYCSLELSGRPKAFYKDDALIVECEKNVIEFASYARITFTIEEKEGADKVEIHRLEPTFKVSRDYIQIFDLEPNSEVRLYDITGKTVAQTHTDAEGNASISVAENGIFILKSKQITFKFVKR